MYGKITSMNKLEFFGRVLKVAISVAGFLMLIGWLVAPAVWTKPLSYLATIALPYIPDLFKLLKIEASAPLVLAYEIFLIVAMVLGIDLNWYSEVLVTADNDSYYDKIVHFSSGILVAAAAQEFFQIYEQRSGSKNPVRWFQILFIMSGVALVAVAWECYEFLYDEIFGGNMQELVKSGVADTMWDMIVSLIGGGIWVIFMVLSRCSKNTPKTKASIDKK